MDIIETCRVAPFCDEIDDKKVKLWISFFVWVLKVQLFYSFVEPHLS